MSQRIVVHTDDDLDGTQDVAREVLFGYKGLPFRIDLKPEHEEKLFMLLAPFIAAGTLDDDENIHSNRIPPEVRAILRKKKKSPVIAFAALMREEPRALPAAEEPAKAAPGEPVAERGESGRKHTRTELRSLRDWCTANGVDPKRVAIGPIANRFWEAWTKKDPDLLLTRDLLPEARRQLPPRGAGTY
jgi:hypothetical protein